jgi:glycosyltransferase involved in cell wall biosynthesis
MKVIFMMKYGSLAASPRYRFLQFGPELQARGIECNFSPLLDNHYLATLLKKNSKNWVALFYGYLKRVLQLLSIRRYDLVVVHCELFPYLPSIFEKYLNWVGIPYIYDFDDAIFHQYDEHRFAIVRALYRKKIAKVIHGARAVWAGNNYLAEYAKRYNQHVFCFPTVVDMNRYTEKKWSAAPYSQENPFLIGWIGSPSTAPFIREVLPAIQKFCKNFPARLVLVGSGPMNFDKNLPVEILDWKEEDEIQHIHRFDVGIMPLRHHKEWDKGKCAFKLIQYMACGIPVVGSKVGANEELVEDGIDGFLASTEANWIAALQKIYQDRALAAAMGVRAREKIIRKYSRQAITQDWHTSLLAAANMDPRETPCVE